MDDKERDGVREAELLLQKIADLVDDENACNPLDDAIGYANKALAALSKHPDTANESAEAALKTCPFYSKLTKRTLFYVGSAFWFVGIACMIGDVSQYAWLPISCGGFALGYRAALAPTAT